MRIRTGPIKPEAMLRRQIFAILNCERVEILKLLCGERLTICQNAKIIFPQLKDNGQGVRKLKCGEKCCPVPIHILNDLKSIKMFGKIENNKFYLYFISSDCPDLPFINIEFIMLLCVAALDITGKILTK